MPQTNIISTIKQLINAVSQKETDRQTEEPCHPYLDRGQPEKGELLGSAGVQVSVPHLQLRHVHLHKPETPLAVLPV